MSCLHKIPIDKCQPTIIDLFITVPGIDFGEILSPLRRQSLTVSSKLSALSSTPGPSSPSPGSLSLPASSASNINSLL